MAISKITWSGSFLAQVNIPYPIDNAVGYSVPREGSEWSQAVSGIEDANILGTDYVFEGDIRWIPNTNSTNPLATGWSGSNGVQSFLEWARQKNTFRFYPNASGTFVDSYLVEPMMDAPTLEPDGTRRIHIKIRNAGSSSYSGY